MSSNLTAKDFAVNLKERPTQDIADDRHKAMMDAIAPYAKPTVQKNLTPVYVDYKTRETSMVLVLCPEWSPYMPPFSLAKLSGIAKAAGYETTIMDLNVRVYNTYRNDWQPNNKLPFRLWDPSASWHWLGDTYTNDIHPLLEPILMSAVDEIMALNPTVVGFSVYYISEEPTKWMCQELKRRNPDILIAVGGPNVHKNWFRIEPYYDYVIVGEGEKNLLVMLDEIEEGWIPTEPRILNQPENERININSLPMPDYESIDFSQYEMPNGVNTEISRGCTAKCSFCEETHFWKYRQRQAVDLITEIEWLYYNKGTDVIWFIDSLINGNINELRAFALALKSKQLDVKFAGYARHDGRMDRAYLQDLKDGGCLRFNFGTESGSQKVLDDMHKGVTIAEMEQNFKDCYDLDIGCDTNWIVGFSTEDFQDYSDTMTLQWRMRHAISNMGLGVGFAVGPETIVGQNPHKFNVSWHKYQSHWITNDLTMGGTHVMTRVKNIHIWADLISHCKEGPAITYPVRYGLANEHYKIKLNHPNLQKEMFYEKFDYNIIPPVDENNPFANQLVNEMWPFFRNLWRARGGYQAEIYFNPEIDLKEFGSQFGPGMFNAVYKFSITDDGQWEADFDMKFDQIANSFDERTDPERIGPFYAQDYSRAQSNTAKRARKLAKPSWSNETGRDDNEFWELLVEEKELNSTIDFSFALHWKDTGDWSNWRDYTVDVSNSKRDLIPEKEAENFGDKFASLANRMNRDKGLL